jgi:hypothetical protein
MKKVLTILVVAGMVGAGLWLYTNNAGIEGNLENTQLTRPDSSQQDSAATNVGGTNPDAPRDAIINSSSNQTGPGAEDMDDVKPATEAYSNAEDALAAALKGAKDFDDSILEQFTEPSPDCSWCPAFYSSIQELVMNPNTPQDQKSYMAEILAISGRAENVQTLVQAIKNAPNATEADLFAEALELTLGKDEVTTVLGDQLSSTNDTLREASVAAITNQGTRQAAELLAKHVQERNDPDAYYSVGIGPGEFIPDEDALPYVQEQVQKRDQYSAAWAKSMINAGLPGLQSLFEQMDSSTNYDSDRALIKDAIDHVNFEDGIKELADNVIASNKNPVAVEFAKQIQAEISQQETEEPAGTTEQ